VEYVVMIPSRAELVFGLGLLWAWIQYSNSIYGTSGLLGIAYFTCSSFGLCARSPAWVLQSTKAEECARVAAPHGPINADGDVALLRPASSRMAADLHRLVRELGVSVFLMGPNSRSSRPSIVNSW